MAKLVAARGEQGTSVMYVMCSSRQLPTVGVATTLYSMLGSNLCKHLPGIAEFSPHRLVVSLLQRTNLGIGQRRLAILFIVRRAHPQSSSSQKPDGRQLGLGTVLALRHRRRQAGPEPPSPKPKVPWSPPSLKPRISRRSHAHKACPTKPSVNLYLGRRRHGAAGRLEKGPRPVHPRGRREGRLGGRRPLLPRERQGVTRGRGAGGVSRGRRVAARGWTARCGLRGTCREGRGTSCEGRAERGADRVLKARRKEDSLRPH